MPKRSVLGLVCQSEDNGPLPPNFGGFQRRVQMAANIPQWPQQRIVRLPCCSRAFVAKQIQRKGATGNCSRRAGGFTHAPRPVPLPTTTFSQATAYWAGEGIERGCVGSPPPPQGGGNTSGHPPLEQPRRSCCLPPSPRPRRGRTFTAAEAAAGGGGHCTHLSLE